MAKQTRIVRSVIRAPSCIPYGVVFAAFEIDTGTHSATSNQQRAACRIALPSLGQGNQTGRWRSPKRETKRPPISASDDLIRSAPKSDSPGIPEGILRFFQPATREQTQQTYGSLKTSTVFANVIVINVQQDRASLGLHLKPHLTLIFAACRSSPPRRLFCFSSSHSHCVLIGSGSRLPSSRSSVEQD
ncbi:hypothetical protein BDP81DRAFT_19538 [Colletotrichum phormii]|uniref:Uncharacterized protein n=1 Tax=Colletotrichum phormii TaxID=359342 RepID=A0AAJ0EKD5_9PEZI|nr:uncharacterized protein BDP81DRAFT_19538 [Colletotrichum phormii]KAK1656310.1 hypothetical protein BDP81DRAFT_19538 [Colletotrichum phormii]